MASQADFTDEEWKKLHMGVSGAGMLVSLADADFTDSFGEVTALAKHLASEATTGPTQLVREIAGVHSTGFGAFASPTKLHDETVDALTSSVATLRSKAPDEVAPYRALVLGTAQVVAEAKGGVKPAETAAIAAITGALGTD